MKNNAPLSILIGFLLFFSMINCKPLEQQNLMPSCVAAKIENLIKRPIQNPPAEVWKWESNGKNYYYFNSPCCDQFNVLYNDACEVICAPDGGFTGKGDGKCPDFDNEVKRTIIWKDERKTPSQKSY